MPGPYDYIGNLPQLQGQQGQGAMAPGMTPGIAPQGQPIMDPTLMAQLLGTQGDLRQISRLEKQLEEARALRDTAMPQGRQAGRVYVAPNPLESIGAMMKMARGYRDERDIQRGVRNPGYGPGVTTTPQPEYSKEGIDQIEKRVGESERRIGEEWAKGRRY